MAAAPGRLPGGRGRPREARSGRASLELRLEPTEDILATLAAGSGEEQTIVGFAAEHGEGGVERARAKLEAQGRR